MRLRMARPAISAACNARPTLMCALILACLPRWLAMSRARWAVPIRPYGRKPARTPKLADRATPNAASRAWTSHPSMSRLRLPTTCASDYSLRTGQEVSILTLSCRIHVPYQGWSRHVTLFHAGATFGAAKLWYDRGRKRFYLLVTLTIEIPDPTPESQRQIVGVDVGSRYLATVATVGKGAQFYSGNVLHLSAHRTSPAKRSTTTARSAHTHLKFRPRRTGKQGHRSQRLILAETIWTDF